MENKGTRKVIVIVILAIMVLGLGGYIAYDMFILDKQKANEKNSEIKELKAEIKDLTNENDIDGDVNIIGYYAYEKEDTDEIGRSVYLGLFENNSAVLIDSIASPIRYFGGYEVNDDKIIFNYKWIDASQTQQAYEGILNFTIDDEELILNENNTDNISLKKITKDEYYNALKTMSLPISTKTTN